MKALGRGIAADCLPSVFWQNSQRSGASAKQSTKQSTKQPCSLDCFAIARSSRRVHTLPWQTARRLIGLCHEDRRLIVRSMGCLKRLESTRSYSPYSHLDLVTRSSSTMFTIVKPIKLSYSRFEFEAWDSELRVPNFESPNFGVQLESSGFHHKFSNNFRLKTTKSSNRKLKMHVYSPK